MRPRIERALCARECKSANCHNCGWCGGLGRIRDAWPLHATSTPPLRYSNRANGEPVEPTEHNYMKKLIEMFNRGEMPEGRVSDAIVEHDWWCGLNRHGRCDCDPSVRVILRPDPGLN